MKPPTSSEIIDYEHTRFINVSRHKQVNWVCQRKSSQFQLGVVGVREGGIRFQTLYCGIYTPEMKEITTFMEQLEVVHGTRRWG